MVAMTAISDVTFLASRVTTVVSCMAGSTLTLEAASQVVIVTTRVGAVKIATTTGIETDGGQRRVVVCRTSTSVGEEVTAKGVLVTTAPSSAALASPMTGHC